jgi:hypothetical protein
VGVATPQALTRSTAPPAFRPGPQGPVAEVSGESVKY